MTQPWYTALGVCCLTTHQERNYFAATGAMHETLVSHPSALAREAELQRVLASEDHDHKL